MGGGGRGGDHTRTHTRTHTHARAQAFSESNIVSYLQSVLRGKEQTAEVKPWPMVWRKVVPWDGTDPPPEEPSAEGDDV